MLALLEKNLFSITPYFSSKNLKVATYWTKKETDLIILGSVLMMVFDTILERKSMKLNK